MFRSWKQLIALFVLTGAPALAVPPGFNIQGRLTDAGGVNRDGVFALKFSIFDSATGGANLWTRTYPSVTVRNGNFQLILTDPADNPSQVLADSFGADSRHLEIQVLSGPGVSTPEAPLVPRQQLVSVPFALKTGALTSPNTAITAKIGGTEYLRIHTNGNVGIGITNPAQKLDVAGSAQMSGGAIVNQLGATWGGWNEAIRLPVPGHAAITYPPGGLLFGLHGNTNFYWANTTAGTYSMVLGNTGNLALGSNTFLAGSSGGSYLNAGNVGIGTFSPGAKLEVRSSISGQAAYIRSDSTSGTNYGVDAEAHGAGATTNIGGYFAASGASNNYAIIVPPGYGRVGIGTTSPGEALTVVGTIQSTSGGFKFPDGTVQATAAGSSDSTVSAVTLSGNVPAVALPLPGIGAGDHIRVKWALVQSSPGGEIHLRFNNDSAGRYQTSDRFITSTGGASQDSGSFATKCYMGRNTIAVTPGGMSVGEYVLMLNPNSSAQAQGSFHSNFNSGATDSNSVQGGCFYSGPSAITSVTIFTSAGGFRGKVKIDKIQ